MSSRGHQQDQRQMQQNATQNCERTVSELIGAMNRASSEKMDKSSASRLNDYRAYMEKQK